MPTSVDVDMKTMAEGVRGAVPPEAKIRGLQVKDIAYGLKALLVMVQMDDKGGVVDKVEAAFKAIPHVENVEVIDTTLL
jgi:elongation factor 1-beta